MNLEIKKLTPEEKEDFEKEHEKQKEKERKHTEPLIDYLFENCSIQRIGFDGTQTGEKIKLKELIDKTKNYLKQFDKTTPPEKMDSPYIKEIEHKVGIIQITDEKGEISSILNDYQRIGALIESTYDFTNMYENGIYHPRSPSYYWQFTTHYNFDLDKLNNSFEDDITFLKKDLQSFERAFTLGTFMNYLDTLGYPNGIDNWDNEKIFKADYLLGNDISHLIGNEKQLERYFKTERYNNPNHWDIEIYFEEKTKLEEIISTLFQHNLNKI